MLGYWIDTASKDKMERLVHSTLERKVACVAGGIV